MKIQNNPPKKHHYIPRSYLKRWLNKDGYLHVFQIKPYKHFKSNEKGLVNICQQNYLYTTETIIPDNKQYVEQELSAPFDDHFNQLLLKLKPGNIDECLSPYEKRFFIHALGTFPHRSPWGMEKMKERLNEELFKLDCAPIKKEYLSLMLFRPVYQIFSEDILMQKEWHVVETPENLLTCDMPFVNYNGILSQNFCFLFAIDPRHLLFCSNCNEKLKNNTVGLGDYFNTGIIKCAYRHIISTDNSQKKMIKRILKKINRYNC